MNSLSKWFFYSANSLAEGLTITWLAYVLLYIGTGLPGANGFHQVGHLQVYLLFFGCAIVACAALKLLATNCKYHKIHPIVVGAGIAAMCTSVFVLPWLVSSWILILFSIGISGVGSACIIAVLSVSLENFSHKAAIFSTPAAVLFAGLTTVLLFFVQPQTIQLFCVVGLSIVTPVLILGSRRFISTGNGQHESENHVSANSMDWRAFAAVIAHEACVGYGAYTVVYLCLAGREEVVFACGTAVGIVAVITELFALRPKARENYFESERIQLKFMLPLAALGIIPIIFVDDIGKIICCTLLFAVFTPQIITNINALTENVRIKNLNPVESFCGGYISNFTGLLVGFAVACITFLLSSRGLLLEAGLSEFALLILLMLLSAIFFADRYPREPATRNVSETSQLSIQNENLENAENKLRWRDKCGIVADRYELSPRQSEVLFLLSRGYANKSIEEQLDISSHTVKSHIAAIYQKTGVHSKQQIIDLVKEARED